MGHQEGGGSQTYEALVLLCLCRGRVCSQAICRLVVLCVVCVSRRSSGQRWTRKQARFVPFAGPVRFSKPEILFEHTSYTRYHKLKVS